MVKSILEGLTDEQILKEFVKRFKCDGALIAYLDSNVESGLIRWRNKEGKKWAENVMSKLNYVRIPKDKKNN